MIKKLLTLSILSSVIGLGAAKAQTTTGTTNLHVKLVDVIGLVVNNNDVNINFASIADYQNGVSVAMNNHLTVTSNKPYTLNVKAAGNLAGTGSNSDVLLPSVVTVQLPTGGNNTGLGVTPTTVAGLATTDAALLSNATPAILKPIDVTYAVPAAVSSTSALLGKKADTYTTVVTYSIVTN